MQRRLRISQSLNFSMYALALLGLPLMQIVSSQNTSSVTNGLDPVVNFCTRFQHQSTLKQGVLYIDGGIQTYRLDGLNFTNGTWVPNQVGINPGIITTSMNESWNWWTNITQRVISKDTNPRGDLTPDRGVIRGAMFAGGQGDSRMFTFGGTSFMGNSTWPGWRQIEAAATPLWSYDSISNEWVPYGSNLQERPNYGASADVSSRGLGFYLNGQVDNGSHYTTQEMRENTFSLNGMVVIDLDTQRATNISTEGLGNDYPRIGGNLQYVSNIGNAGVLVSLGGAYREGANYGPWISQQAVTYEQIDIFDLSSYLENPSSNGTWYSQNTSGTIPPPRIDACTVALSAPDNSSHNIYLYGGRNPFGTNYTIYDDIWALSLPSFIWTKIFEGQSPRWGHSCHVAGNRQLLTVSGSLNTTYLGCDWEQRGVAVFDLSSKLWGSAYNTNDPAYNVTQDIVDVIGGDGNGGATVTTPAVGFQTAGLQSLFSTNAPQQASDGQLSKGAIAGAIIGSLAGATVLAGIGLRIWRRKSRAKRAERREGAELDGNNTAEMDAHGKPISEVLSDSRYEMGSVEPAAELSPETHVVHEMPAEAAKTKVDAPEEFEEPLPQKAKPTMRFEEVFERETSNDNNGNGTEQDTKDTTTIST